MFQRLCHLYRTSMTRLSSNKRSTMNQANAQKVLRFCSAAGARNRPNAWNRPSARNRPSACLISIAKLFAPPFACTGQEQHAAAGGRSKSGLEGIWKVRAADWRSTPLKWFTLKKESLHIFFRLSKWIPPLSITCSRCVGDVRSFSTAKGRLHWG